MSADILTAEFTFREGAEVLAAVSELGDERILQMTEVEAKELRDLLVSLLGEDDDA